MVTLTARVKASNKTQNNILYKKETSNYFLNLLNSVITKTKFTGPRVEIEGYMIGGKTGTSELLNPNGGYYKDRNEARNNRTKTRDRLIDKHQASGILTGMTLNPSELMIEGRDESRDKERQFEITSSHGVPHYRPFINDTKKVIAELYNKHNLESLSKLTISCEAVEPPRPCKECWWCKEKHWAFGYY